MGRTKYTIAHVELLEDVDRAARGLTTQQQVADVKCAVTTDRGNRWMVVSHPSKLDALDQHSRSFDGITGRG